MRAVFLLLLYLSLTRSAFAAPCETLLQSPMAAVRRCGSLSVVRLSGAPKERARMMGELLRGPLSPDVVNYFSQKVPSLAREQAGLLGTPLALLYNQVVRLFHRATPVPLAEEVDAMARGMRIDPIALRRGLSLPDTGVLLQGLGSVPGLEFLPSTGCSSVATPLPGGGFVYGRNLDFAGVGTFDRHPMLLSIEPEAGSGELRHLVLGADGLLFGGITGVNEAGLTFSIHQNFSRDVGIRGVPMILIGELLLRQARTLEEAEKIIAANRPASIWTFVVTDLKNGQVLAVEASQKHLRSRWSNGAAFVQTNHNMHAESRADENSDFGVLANSEYRMKVAFDLLAQEKRPSAALLARILSHQDDKDGFFSGYRDVLKGETLQTVIFETRPSQPTKLFLSVDPAPASGGRYAAFRLEDFWKNGAMPEPEIVDLAATPPAKRQRQRAIAEAYHTYFDLRQPLEAAALLQDHPTLDAALFRAFAHYHSGRFAEAEKLAGQALLDPRFMGEPAYVRQSVETVRLVSWIRLGHKDEARRLAEKLSAQGPVKPRLKRLAELVLQGKKPPAWMLHLGFNFFSGDLGGRKD